MFNVEDKNGDSLRNKVQSISCESVEESQKNYGKWAETYEKDLLQFGYSAYLAVCKQICEKFPPESRSSVRILDIGAGTGLVAKELRQQGFKNIDALEPQETMLNEARKLNLYENYFQTFITEKPSDIPANTYDALTGSGIYAAGAHVPCEALIEMIRLVKPGGYITLSTRHSLIQEAEAYKDLEPLMNRLEADGKWKKESREIWPRFYLDKDGIVWCFKVL
ncbi:ubiquinone biosynthesis O-methyltransferase-like [Ruditapes philippinarum]|uniref:ubiquinone biosynthesis O-methyltransferase-like n=1 Tax=Ruditapes philippinarum TaxID=129788 RepID=UPI00295BF1D5|nr:ubiquinone biosynthesis O-methyltransferase-like [Ruditapes philippinarum]XP_060558747.1 ubiquinone biosynthesis O-methyltransferase-like [Ruditapes philippinarum]